MESVAAESRDTSIGTKATNYVGEGIEDQRYNEHSAANRVGECKYREHVVEPRDKSN
jgi:hypothetical protein